MSDLATLHSRLSRLLADPAPVSGTARFLAFGAGQARTAVRREIDETQLARRLVFRNDRGEEMALDVAAGRLLRSSSPKAPLASEPNDSTATDRISDQPDLTGLKREIEKFSSDAVSVSVEAFILKRTSMILDMGVPSDALFSDTVATAAPPVVRKLDAFLALTGDLVQNIFAYDEGCVVYEKGDAQARQEFDSKIVPILRTGGLLSDGNTMAECLILSPSGKDTFEILCARKENTHVVAFLRRQSAEAVMRHWTDTFSAF